MSAANLRSTPSASLKPSIRSVTSLGRSHQDKLFFTKSETSALAFREYGLMRIASVRVTTPFPRVTPAVDAETLRERLVSQQRMDTAGAIEQRAEMFDGRTRKEDAGSLQSGPPHPKKDVGVNTKSVMKNIDKHVMDWQTHRKSSHFLNPRSRKESYSNRSSISEYLSLGTPHPKKKVVLNPVNLVKRLTEANIAHTLKRAKKVVIITPRPSVVAKGSLENAEGSTAQKSISFEERRRLFDTAEFTIAKNGKKMCEMPLPNPNITIDISDSIYHVDVQARDEIENFIKIQGLIKTSPNTLASVPLSQRNTAPVFIKSERPSVASQRSGSIISKNSIRSSAPSKHTSFFKRPKTPSSILRNAFHFQKVPSQRSIAFNS